MTAERKVAVVVGGAGLIGGAVVNRLSDLGREVIVIDVNEPISVGARFIPGDLSKREIESRLYEELAPLTSCLESWVNAAYPRTPFYGTYDFLDDESDDGITHFTVHGGTFYRACRLAVRLMSEGHGGSIVNFGSIYGQLGPDMRIYEGTKIRNPATYAMSKEAIVGLTRYVATCFASRGIRCNVVCPGGVFDGHGEPFKSRYEARIPMGRMAKPEEVAAVAAFLATDASSYVTGQVVMADGGLSAW